MKCLYLLIPLILIFLFIFPVFLKVRLSYNLFQNIGVIAVFFFGIKVLSLKFKVTQNGVLLFFKKSEDVLEFNKKVSDSRIVENLINQIKDKIKLKSLALHYNIGVGNACQTAMLCGGINSLILAIFARIKCLKPTASLFLGDNPSFNETIFQIAMSLKLSISLFDLVYSFVISVMLTIKQNKT